jgi:hypothetical protein
MMINWFPAIFGILKPLSSTQGLDYSFCIVSFCFACDAAFSAQSCSFWCYPGVMGTYSTCVSELYTVVSLSECLHDNESLKAERQCWETWSYSRLLILPDLERVPTWCRSRTEACSCGVTLESLQRGTVLLELWSRKIGDQHTERVQSKESRFPSLMSTPADACKFARWSLQSSIHR